VTGPQRRRRARTLVVALLTGLLAVVLLGRVPADARPTQTGGTQEPCGGLLPACTQPGSSITSGDVTSTTDDATTSTTDDDDVTTTTDDDATDDTSRQTATTEELVTTTVLRVSTSLDLLVPGDGTAGAESTTTTELVAASGGKGGLSDNQLVALIVSGLALMGTAVGVLTLRYWRATQPVEVPIEPMGREVPRAKPRTQRSVFLDP
jgi:hypothetical protein